MKTRNVFHSLILIILSVSCSNKSKKVKLNNDEIPLKNISPSKDDIIYKGDIQFSTQTEIDNFEMGDYTFIDGNVTISSKDYDNNYLIENINSFNKIKSINGDLALVHLDSLKSLKGFNNLEVINGDFSFSSNYNEERESFENLKIINGDIYFGTNEKSFKGLNSLNTAKNIYLVGIESEKNKVFNNLKTARKIYIDHASIDSISLFPNLQKVETNITFEYSSDLTYIDLPKLEEVGGYFGVTDVPNLENINIPNIKKINNFLIFLDNDNWKRYCFISKYIKENKIDTLDIRGTLLSIDKKDFIEECEK